MTSAARVRTPATDRAFAVFWLAQAINRFGDPMTIVALGAITYQLTGSALSTSAVVLVASVPQATFGFIAGALADAMGHRRAAVVCDLLRAACLVGVGIAMTLALPLAISYAFVLLAALCAAVYAPARVALVPALVPADRLVSANSRIYATDRGLEIAGAVTGGVLVATIGAQVFFIDALTFAISAVLLSSIAMAAPPAGFALVRTSLARSSEAVRILRRDTILFANTWYSLLAQACIPVLNGLLVVLVFRQFGGGSDATAAVRFGLAEGTLAAGAVAGAVVITRLSRAVRKGRLVIGGFAACGALLVAVALAPSYELLLVALFGVGVANVAFYVPNVAILQERTSVETRAAVIGARISLLSLSWLPVMLLAGGLADRLPVSLLIGVAGAFTFVVALLGTRISAIRDVA